MYNKMLQNIYWKQLTFPFDLVYFHKYIFLLTIFMCTYNTIDYRTEYIVDIMVSNKVYVHQFFSDFLNYLSK